MQRFLLISFGALFLILGSCKSDNPYTGDCFIPDVPVNFTINMDLPEYYHMQSLGEYMLLDGGNRGIFLIHNYDGYFYAIERTCTYESERECSTLHLDQPTLQLKCGTPVDTGFVECCSSRFLLDSRVVQGPARCDLKLYRVNRTGNTLYINN